MEKISPIIISVTGWSGSGKTTFCEALISELTGRGRRVSAVKNTHQNLNVDKAGSDSHRFFNSGAESVCLNAGNSMTLFRHKTISDPKELISLFAGSDFIIAEGFKAADSVKIEVTGMIESADEMKNAAPEADIIIYGISSLKDDINRKYQGKTGNMIFIQRNNIKAAADYIDSLLT